jgi:hypothetical protein
MSCGVRPLLKITIQQLLDGYFYCFIGNYDRCRSVDEPVPRGREYRITDIL